MEGHQAPLGQLLESVTPSRVSEALCAQPGFALWSRGKHLEPVQSDGEVRGSRVLRRFRVPETGLEVEQVIEPVAGYGVAVLRVTLRQGDAGPSPPLEAVQPLHLRLEGVRRRPRQPCSIYTTAGGTTESYYPPLAFRENRVQVLERGASDPFRVSSAPGGRSSGDTLPFLMVQFGAGSDSAGLVAGLEWSGRWEMGVHGGMPGQLDVSTHRLDDLYVVGGPLVNDMVLEPGEVLELPAVHVAFFEGGHEAGFNRVRRYIHQRVCPKLDGEPPLPPISYDHWYGLYEGFDEEVLKRQARLCAEMGVEYFVLDATWFPGVKGGDFSPGLGNWTRVDAGKFPRGIEPLAEYVRRQGMSFGLWFDIEHAHTSSDLFAQHPEWFWDIGTDDAHLDLTLPEAQEYVIETVSEWVARLDLRWTRWDYNIDPEPYWHKADPTGKVQFAYMEGLYRVLDELLRRHPKLLLETCASGGRRIDLGTLGRAHSAWISDHTVEPHIVRFMQSGASRFLPGNLLNSAVPAYANRRDLPNAGLEFLSRMMGALSVDGEVTAWTPAVVGEAARHIRGYMAVRHLLVQDFFPLTRQPTNEGEWDAAQFVSYDGSESVVFAFRMGGERSDIKLNLRGLLEGEDYELTELPGEDAGAVHSSAALSDSGLPVHLQRDRGTAFHLRIRRAAG